MRVPAGVVLWVALGGLSWAADAPLLVAPVPADQPLGVQPQGPAAGQPPADAAVHGQGDLSPRGRIEPVLRLIRMAQADDGAFSPASWPQPVRDELQAPAAPASADEKIAATSLALVAHLHAGSTHQQRDAVGAAMQRGLTWLLQQQDAEGRFSGDALTQAVATLALVRARALGQDGTLNEAARRACLVLVAQGKEVQQGNQRFSVWSDSQTAAADVRATTWAMQALREAQGTGIALPQFREARSVLWLLALWQQSNPGKTLDDPTATVFPLRQLVDAAGTLGATIDEPGGTGAWMAAAALGPLVQSPNYTRSDALLLANTARRLLGSVRTRVRASEVGCTDEALYQASSAMMSLGMLVEVQQATPAVQARQVRLSGGPWSGVRVEHPGLGGSVGAQAFHAMTIFSVHAQIPQDVFIRINP